MKTLIAIVVTLFFLTSAKATAQDEGIASGNSKDRNLFVFKAEKKFVGAIVEIYASDGELLTSQNLIKRKMIIDFGPVMKDTYTIRVVKGNETQEFHYQKK